MYFANYEREERGEGEGDEDWEERLIQKTWRLWIGPCVTVSSFLVSPISPLFYLKPVFLSILTFHKPELTSLH